MVGTNDIVITGIGCVSPIGIGRAAFWEGLRGGTCGIRSLHQVDGEHARNFVGGTLNDFDAKQYVTPRKALKVMNREVQTAYSAAHLAWQDAGLESTELESDRVGVIFGSEMLPGELSDVQSAVRGCSVDGVMQHDRWGSQFSKHIFPLWMLKNLPNMPACHVGIAINARGPNNTIAQEEISGLQALIEASMIIQRDKADLMVVGAVGGRVGPTRLLYRRDELYYRQPPIDSSMDNFCRPFDRRRAGIVPAEGAVALVIERRSHAVRRQANVLAELVGFANRFAAPDAPHAGSQRSIANAVSAALDHAGVTAEKLGMIAAQGFSQQTLDVTESQALARVLPQVPVTAFSSYFGTAGAACGLLELSAGMLATSARTLLPTLGFEHADPACPIHVTSAVTPLDREYMLKLSFTPSGHAVAVILRCNS